jgi:mycothiol synthase
MTKNRAFIANQQEKMMNLPKGYTMRATTMDDLEGAVATFNACSMELIGEEAHDVEVIRAEWESPGLTIEEDTRVVEAPDGSIAGYVEVWNTAPHVRPFTWVRVHPEHRGRGVGSLLLEWGEGHAHASIAKAPEGARVVLQQEILTTDEASQALLKGAGYGIARYFFRMLIEMDAPPPPPTLSNDLVLRPYKQGEEAAVVRAVREAFRDHWGHVEGPFEEEYERWMHWIENDPGFDPELWIVAMDGDEVAGMALCRAHMPEDPQLGWVSTLGVRRPWRRQGLGLALLHHVFGQFYRRGKPKVGLGVDAGSLTGATRLYEKAGMHVQRQYTLYQKALREGKDLSTQTLG